MSEPSTSQSSTSSIVKITLNYNGQPSQPPPLYNSSFSSTSSPSSAHVTSTHDHTNEQCPSGSTTINGSIPSLTTTTANAAATANNSNDNIPLPYLLQELPALTKFYESWDPGLQSAILSTLIKRSTKSTLQLANSLIHPILKRDFLASLPYELRLQIISYLDVKSLCEASLVSKTWNSLIYNDQQTWYRLLLQDGFVIPTSTAPASLAHSNETTTQATPSTSLPASSLTANALTKHTSAKNFLNASTSSSSTSSYTTAIASPFASQSPPPAPDAGSQCFHINYRDIYRSQYTLKMNWKYGRFKRTTFDAHTDNIVTSLQFDEHKIVSGATDSLINVYSTRDPQHQRFTLSGHDGGVWALQYVGNTLVSGSVDRTVRVWDLNKRKCTHVFKGHTSTVRCLLIVMPVVTASGKKEPSEPLIVTGARDSSIRVWKLPELNTETYVDFTATTAMDGTAASAEDDGDSMDFTSGPITTSTTTARRSRSPPRQSRARTILVEQDSSSPSSVEEDGDEDEEMEEVAVGNDDDDDEADEGEDDDDDNSSNDENRAPATTTATETTNVDAAAAAVVAATATAPTDDSVYVGDGFNPWFKFFMVGHTDSVRSIAAYGNTLISGSYDNTVGVWNLETGRLVHRMEGHTSNVYTVVIDPPRQQCMSGSMDSVLYIWDYVTGECLHKLDGHSSLVGLLGLTPNYLVSAAADRTVRVWDPNTGVCEHVLAGEHGHTGAITCFKHDEEKVISGSEGGLKVWDIKTGKFMYDLVEGVKGVWWLAYNRSKCVVSVHNADKTWLEVLDFDIEPASAEAAAKATSERSLMTGTRATVRQTERAERIFQPVDRPLPHPHVTNWPL